MSIDQEQSLRILENALWCIARESGCDYQGSGEDRPVPCTCGHCVAGSALRAARDWRFRGASWERTQRGDFPREMKMLAAWKKLAERSPDELLSQALREDQVPGARDWYVATTVIQWLATNVGMTVLEAAGFKYQQWDQDRADGELFSRRQKEEVSSAHRQEQESTSFARHQELESSFDRRPEEVPSVGHQKQESSPAQRQDVLPSGVGWSALIEQLNALRRRLDDKPRKERHGYSLHPGSILNAYREGDLSFSEASDLLSSEEFAASCEALRRGRSK